MIAALVIVFASLSAFAGDHEATIYNHTEELGYCYNNHPTRRCITQDLTYPNSACIGDAFGTQSAVFKVPDRTTFYCTDEGCRPDGAISQAVFTVAALRKGYEHYGRMSMNAFKRLMGNREICQDHYPHQIDTEESSSR